MKYLRGNDGDGCSIKFLLKARGDSPRLNLGGGSGEGARSLPSLRRTYEAKRFFADSLTQF